MYSSSQECDLRKDDARACRLSFDASSIVGYLQIGQLFENSKKEYPEVLLLEQPTNGKQIMPLIVPFGGMATTTIEFLREFRAITSRIRND